MTGPENYESIPMSQHQESLNPLTNVLRFLNSMMRRKWTILGWVSVCVALGLTYYVMAPRMYESSAELLILHTGEGNVDATQQSQKMLQEHLPTYTKVLASEEVLKGALQRLPRDQQEHFIGLTKHKAIEKLRKFLTVSTTRQTNLLQVSYRAMDPDSSAVIVSEILNSYFAFMQEMHQNSSREMLSLLSLERTKIEQQIAQKQDELLRLRAESDSLLGTGDNVMSVVNERVIELNRMLAAAQKETIESHSYYTAVDNAIRNGEDLQQFITQANSSLAGELMKIGIGVDSRDSQVHARLQQQLIDDQAKLQDKLNNKLGPNHPEVQQLQHRIATTQLWLKNRVNETLEGSSRINQELGPRLLQMARQRYQHALLSEREIYQRFEQEKHLATSMNQRLVLVQLAERDLTRLQTDYDMLRERINTLDLNQQTSLRSKITKHAEPNPRPVTPQLTSSVALSLLLGLFMGAVTVILLDLLDDRFHSPDELKAQIGAPVLAMVRDLTPLSAEFGLESLHTYAKPNSVETEAFRTLRTAIEFAGESHQRISISSTEPSDGKTTVISNTAVAFAQAGRRTLVIDGDMRRPGLTRLFGLKGQQGLSTILRDSRGMAESVRDNLVNSGMENLDIIAAGPRPSNPVELLTSDRFAELIAWAEA